MAKNQTRQLEQIPIVNLEESEISVIPSDAIIDETTVPEFRTVSNLNGVTVIDEQGVLHSKRFMKGALSFQSPEEFLSPLLPLLNITGGQLILTGDSEVKNQNTDGSENVSFGRMNLVAKFEIDQDEDIWYEIGILAAFDLGSPKLKVYRGPKTRACLNLNVWGTDDVVKFDISSGINTEVVRNFAASVQEKIAESQSIIRNMKAIKLSPVYTQTIVGKILMQTSAENSANGTSAILRAVNLLNNKDSRYFHKQEDFNLWKMHNALTEHFAEKVNFFDIPEKTKESYRLLSEIVAPPTN